MKKMTIKITLLTTLALAVLLGSTSTYAFGGLGSIGSINVNNALQASSSIKKKQIKSKRKTRRIAHVKKLEAKKLNYLDSLRAKFNKN